MQLVDRSSLNLSILLHAGLVVIALIGLPALLPTHPDPTPLVMSVEILPISGVTNVKPSDKPIQHEQHAPALKMPKPLPPPVAEKPKEPPPPEKHFDPAEEAEPTEKPKPEPKPEPPKPEAKPKPDDFAALLNKLKQENTAAPPVKAAKDKTEAVENKTRSDAPYDASQPLSISERDAIRSQFIPCWRAPAGAKDAGSLAVRVRVELLEDGTVKTAVITSDQQSRYNSDSYFRAAADSALRAVHKCSPLKNLPPDKFGTWGTMEINFDPKDML